MRSISNILVSLTILVPSACYFMIDGDGTLSLVNTSSYVLDEIHLAEEGDLQFGPDLTGQESLFPGQVLAVELPCDEYAVLLYDEFGAPCVLYGIDVCSDETVFRVTDSLINDCNFGRSFAGL